MSTPLYRLAALAAGCLWAACSTSDTPLACATAQLVYERDDRRQPYELGPQWESRGALQTVALLDRTLARNLISGAVSVRALRADALLELCSDEPFAEQPTIASCGCRALAVLRGFQNGPHARWPGIAVNEIHHCSAVIHHAPDALLGTGRDVALIRIDPPFPRFSSAKLRAATPGVGEPLVTLGHPLGVPCASQRLPRSPRSIQQRALRWLRAAKGGARRRFRETNLMTTTITSCGLRCSAYGRWH